MSVKNWMSAVIVSMGLTQPALAQSDIAEQVDAAAQKAAVNAAAAPATAAANANKSAGLGGAVSGLTTRAPATLAPATTAPLATAVQKTADTAAATAATAAQQAAEAAAEKYVNIESAKRTNEAHIASTFQPAEPAKQFGDTKFLGTVIDDGRVMAAIKRPSITEECIPVARGACANAFLSAQVLEELYDAEKGNNALEYASALNAVQKRTMEMR